MRRIIFFIITAMLASTLLAESTGIPESKLELFKNYKLGSWGYHSLDAHFRFDGTIRNSEYQSNETGLFTNTNYYYYKESDEFILYYDNYNSYGFSYNYFDHSTDIFSNSLRTDNIADIKYYLMGKLFIEASTDIDLLYLNDITDTKSSERILEESSTFESTSFLGFGFGKLHDIAPMIRALRMNERLQYIGGERYLSNAEIQKVSEVISRNYSNVYARTDLPYWSDLSAAAGGKLDDLKVHEYEYIKEALFENIHQRFQGYDVSLGMNVLRRAQKRYDEQPEPETIKINDFDLCPILTFRWYNNFSTSLMAGFEQYVQYDFQNVNDDNNNIETVTSLSQLNLLYNITDRILFVNQTSFMYENELLNDKDDKEESSQVANNSRFEYQVIEKLTFNLDLIMSNNNTENVDRFKTSLYAGFRVNLFKNRR